jgi:restriction endonuclease
MKLHFSPNHPYQLDAIRAVTDVFEGQEMAGSEFEFSAQVTRVLFYLLLCSRFISAIKHEIGLT